MNKLKKFGIGAVAVVMSCSMVFSLAACGGTNDPDDTTGGDDDTDYTLTYDSDTVINIAIGHNTYDTGAFYTGQTDYAVSGTMTVSGGYTASAGTLKPAMYALQEALDVKFVDQYTGLSTANNLSATNTSSLVNTGAWNTTVDIATADLSAAVTQATNANSVLNLGDYLDYMPNFKQFLEDNPVVYLSLLQSGMSTTDGSNKTIYVAPYFDGNDDIERYCLVRQDWVEDLLDDTLTSDGDTYATACGVTSTSVSGGWMGTTTSYTIETSTESDSGATTFTLKKDYSAAKTAASDTSTALGGAYYDITGSAYSGDSGNIVDIMNAAINAKSGNVTGKQLATLYRVYIDVCYVNASTGAAAYTTRSDLFNGYSAAWDVDDLVAMLRIVKTNSQNVGLDSCTTEGIFPRRGTNDRTPDIVRLACQLYGERGADSRYEYTYIDQSGTLQDARANVSFWECLDEFGNLADEGLVYEYYNSSTVVDMTTGAETGLKGDGSNPGYGFMMYDYSQTQTSQMFNDMADDDYMFGAINTPVSKWDVDGDGTKEVTMRFTESWRSTKTSGLVVAASVANDTNKLNAVLAFIDYLFSNDGQITSTYGIQASSSAGTDGTWYGTEVTTAVDTGSGLTVNGTVVASEQNGQYVVKEEYESQYFCFNNKLYTGTLYKGKMTPTVTEGLYNDFTTANTVAGSVNAQFKSFGNFTNYARRVLGSTLPMGNKDQSFENQLTAPAAAAAATKVGVSISNGTIKHVTLTIDSNNYWYTSVPTGLPLNGLQQSAIDATSQDDLKYMTGTQKTNSSFYSIYHHVIWYGFSGNYNWQSVSVTFASNETATSWVATLNSTYNLSTRVTNNAAGWTTAKNYWTYLSSVLEA